MGKILGRKGGEDLREEREKIWRKGLRGESPTGKGGKRFKEKGEALRGGGGEGLRGGGKGRRSQGGKGLRGERGERI